MKSPEIDDRKLKKLLKKDFEDCVAEVVEAIDKVNPQVWVGNCR